MDLNQWQKLRRNIGLFFSNVLAMWYKLLMMLGIVQNDITIRMMILFMNAEKESLLGGFEIDRNYEKIF